MSLKKWANSPEEPTTNAWQAGYEAARRWVLEVGLRDSVVIGKVELKIKHTITHMGMQVLRPPELYESRVTAIQHIDAALCGERKDRPPTSPNAEAQS